MSAVRETRAERQARRAAAREQFTANRPHATIETPNGTETVPAPMPVAWLTGANRANKRARLIRRNKYGRVTRIGASNVAPNYPHTLKTRHRAAAKAARHARRITRAVTR